MNTKNKQDQKKTQPQRTRQAQRPKKQSQHDQQGQNSNMLHGDLKHQDHEYPEMRLTR
jgi:hypothetical protein